MRPSRREERQHTLKLLHFFLGGSFSTGTFSSADSAAALSGVLGSVVAMLKPPPGRTGGRRRDETAIAAGLIAFGLQHAHQLIGRLIKFRVTCLFAQREDVERFGGPDADHVVRIESGRDV